MYIRYFLAGLAIALSIWLLSIPIKLAVANWQMPTPQIIFMLGGSKDREVFTAQFAAKHPQLDVWISTGKPPADAISIFFQYSKSTERLHLDYWATDTVTNFTTLVNRFQHMKIRHVYLLTSDLHMPRAKMIAFLIFGSHSIAYTPIEMPSDHAPEVWWRTGRDIARALLWLVTGTAGGISRTNSDLLIFQTVRL